MVSMGKKKPQRPRRVFTPEFKAQIVGMCLRGERSIPQGPGPPDLAHRQVRSPVRRDQQHPVGQVKSPLPARTTIRDLNTTTLGHHSYQLPELPRLQPRERDDPLRPRRRDHLYHTMINHQPAQPATGLRDIP
ncbi:hypothetical protein GCM10023192_69060 [Amycolatopsis samaneae]